LENVSLDGKEYFTDTANTETVFRVIQSIPSPKAEPAKLGVSFPTVNRWENKKTKPSPLAIQKLQKLLSALKKKKNISQENMEEIAASDALKHKKL
jgi:hypothetical protein